MLIKYFAGFLNKIIIFNYCPYMYILFPLQSSEY